MIPQILENGNFKFSDSVNGGYLTRSCCAYYPIISVWDKDLNVIELYDTSELRFSNVSQKIKNYFI